MPRRRTHRADLNQHEIVVALRAVGATVVILSQVGKGVPDLLVGFRGCNFLLEVKEPLGKLKPAQVDFLNTWEGQACTVRSVQDALETIGAWKKGKFVAL